MDTQQTPRRIPNLTFRVLIVGRANAGKTSILQRVCETTESPFIYRGDEEVKLDPSMDRSEHTIDDELVFSNHRGYVFHDSRGIESGSTEELEILQEFIRRKCGERRLRDRLHAIWYCVPMDNQRPGLDLRFFKGICLDQNVPVIAVFTKHDQFIRNVGMHLLDYPDEYPKDSNVSEVAEEQFQEYYLRPLGDDVRFVRLEKMHIKNRRCDDLIVETSAALNEDVAALMLFAVQRDNIGLSVKSALKRVYSRAGAAFDIRRVIRECLIPFPYIWWFNENFRVEEFERVVENEESREELSVRLRLVHVEVFRLGVVRDFRVERSEEEDRDRRRFFETDNRLSSFVKQLVSLPFIHNFATTGLSGHHFVLAVVLILKHATFLRLGIPSPKSAITHAELKYREANIDSKIQEYLTASSDEHTVELFADFIMATDIVPSLTSVSETHVHRKDDRFQRIWGQLFTHSKSIFLPELGNHTGEDK